MAGRLADHDLHLVLKLSRLALTGQGLAVLHPQTKDGNVIKQRFCRHDDIKHFIWLILLLKSVTEVG
jgi:hypothetical protein